MSSSGTTFLQKTCKRVVKYTIIWLFVIGGILFLSGSYLLWSLLSFLKPIALSLIIHFVLPSSVGGTPTTNSPPISNNTIYIIDEHTYCLGVKGGCVLRKQNPFYNVTDVLIAIHESDKTKPLKVVVSTYGGSVHGCQQIIRRLRAHPSGYIVYCNEAWSAGSAVAIASDEIVMNRLSLLGKIDPITREGEARVAGSFHNPDTTSVHPISGVDLMAKASIGVLNSIELFLSDVVPNYTSKEKVIKENLIYSELSHGTGFYLPTVSKWGFNIREPLESEMDVYFGYFQS